MKKIWLAIKNFFARLFRSKKSKTEKVMDKQLPITIDIPSDFLKQQEISGYIVTEKMKSIWAIEIDMLMKVDEICRKHNIQYFMDGGSMLGVARHNGFIPWDDDIDIMMTRPNYDKFISIAKDELVSPYYLQYDGNGSTGMNHAKVRNSNTTMMTANEALWISTHAQEIKDGTLQVSNMGVWIDIFPFDDVPEDDNERKRFIDNLNTIRHPQNGNIYDYNYAYYYNYYSNFNNQDIKSFIRSWNDKNSNMCANLSLNFYKDRFRRYKEDISDTIYMPFEFVSVPMPVGYKHCLDISYPGWETPVKNTQFHKTLILDAYAPYMEHVKKIIDNNHPLVIKGKSR